MLSVLAIVLPIFALILAGWGARRIGVLGPHATSELNRFVVYLALPALLLDIIAKPHWREIWRPDFAAAFGLGVLIVFAATLALRARNGRGLADAAIDGLNASYANTGYMGFPIVLAAIGPAAMAPTLVATIVTVCVLFAGAIVLIEIGMQTERRPLRMALKVAAGLARNPPMIGGVCLALGLQPPGPAQAFLKLLGAAASPCALVALGLFLAEKRDASAADAKGVALMTLLKLVAQPLVTWVLATRVLHLSPALTHTAVLVAALPTGTGPFMVAELYGRQSGVTARVVLYSTILSVATVSLYLAVSS
jgi:predicted permease